MLANCYFTGGVLGSGAGFRCGTLFDDQALVTAYKIRPQSSILPSSQGGSGAAFYSGNTVFFNLFYDVSAQNTQSGADLAYELVCNQGSETVRIKNYKPVPLQGSFGNKLIDLFEIPTVNEQTQTSKTRFSINRDIEINQGETIQVVFSGGRATDNVQFGISEIFVNNNREDFQGSSVDIPNQLNVNVQFGIPYEALRISSTTDGKKEITNLIIDLDSRQENVNVALVVGGQSFNLVRSLINTQSEFESVSAGSRCNLVVRLLAPNQGPAAIASADLKSFSPVGDNLQTHGITAQIFETSFTVAQPPSDILDNRLFFDIANPTSNQVVCSDGSSFNILSVVNSQHNKLSDGHKVEYSLSFDRYTFQQDLTENLILGPPVPTRFSLSNQMQTALSNEGRLDATLYYKVLDKRSNEGNQPEINIQQLPSGSVSFKLALDSQCDVGSSTPEPQPQNPTPGPTEEEGTGNEEEGSESGNGIPNMDSD